MYSDGIIGFLNHDIKTWPLADLSGYFVIGYDSSFVAKICKYFNKRDDRDLCSIANFFKNSILTFNIFENSFGMFVKGILESHSKW